jgi:hypothetical protein
MERALILALVIVLPSCGSTPAGAPNPCVTFCNKMNACKAGPIDCAANCMLYGGNVFPGLAPAPGCPDVSAQQACIDHAVQESCDDYIVAASTCLTCGVLEAGSPCASQSDCQKYRPDYQCDLSRPGGYCTKACTTFDDCTSLDPAVAVTCNYASTSPSFDPQAPVTQTWCLRQCSTDPECRAAEGYTCVPAVLGAFRGVCDIPPP